MKTIKGAPIFISAVFMLVAMPVFAAENNIFLANKNGDKTDQFTAADEVYIEGFCLPAGNLSVMVYITSLVKITHKRQKIVWKQ